MAEKTTKVYEEGNDGLYIFKKTGSTGTASDYASATRIKGMISFSGTVTQTENKIAADNETDYLVRRSPATIEGTLTVVGLSHSDYITLFGEGIKDSNGAILYGASGEPSKVGVIFFNKTHSVDSGIDTIGATAHILYNVTFTLPNISTTTIAEDDTTIRPFELAFTANPINFSGGTCTYSWVNENDEATKGIWDKHFSTYGAETPSISMYIPNETIA